MDARHFDDHIPLIDAMIDRVEEAIEQWQAQNL
jgi:hypothetical protein